MAAAFVQGPPDSTGKKVQVFENTINAQVVEAQAVVLVDTAGAALVTVPVSGPLTDAQLRASGVPVDTELTTADLDTGAGTDTRAVVGLVLAKSGGAVNVSATDPLRTDPTGTTTQPVSDAGGSITVDSGAAFAVQDSEKVADNAGFTDGTTKVLPVGFIFDETAGTALTENDAAAARVDFKRAQVLTLEDGATRGQRAAVSASGAVKVDGSAVTQPVSLASGATAIAKAEDVASADADVGVPAMAVRKATPANTSGTDGDYEMVQMSGGRVWVSATVDAALPAGTNLIGKTGIDQTTPGTTNAVQDIPATAGGLSKFHLVSAASDNATNVKASAGQVYAITAFNLNAAPRYLKFHNTAGTPTAGAGVTDTYLIPGNANGAGLVINIDKGIAFGTGIGITLVTGITDASTVAVAASEVVINVYYK